MRTTRFGAGLPLVLLMAACGSSTAGQTSAVDPTLAPTPTPAACPSPVDESPMPTSCSSAASGGGGAGGPGGPGGAGGGPGGTVVVKWSERVTQTDVGMSSVITQTYSAIVRLSLTKVDIGSWTLAGRADITATFTSDYQSHMSSSLGPCDVHYTDDAAGAGSVDVVDGGLEARDNAYQFYVSIPGLDGSNDTVRDDSGCFGSSNHETTPWPVAPTSPGGSGDYTDPTHIVGSSSKPRQGGEDTVTWDFTLTP